MPKLTANILELDDGRLFLIVTTPKGTKPIFRTQRGLDGKLRPLGWAIFDVRKALAAPRPIDRLAWCIRLRTVRAAKGWTQAQAAEAFGITRVYYNYLEVGKYPLPPAIREFAGI